MSKERIKIGKWKTVFQGFFNTIKQARAKYPDGRIKIWERNFRIPTVIVLAFNESGKFLLTREYKDNHQQYEWRVPGGRADDPRLTPKQHAQKELREETGFSAKKLKKFLIWKTGGWDIYVYLATGLKRAPLLSDENEDIRTYFLPISKVYRMCLDNKI